MSELERTVALRRGIRLEAASLVWMAVEGAAAIGAGVAARSVLLTAFGADSVIELLSAFVVMRLLLVEAGSGRTEALERLELTTTRVAALLLVLLCVYVAASSVAGIVLGLRPEGSVVGLAVSAAAIAIMPFLAWRKIRVNMVLGSAALRADAAESVSCAFLAAVTLVGLGASMALGWWWVQYVAALALLIWIVPEAREAIEEAREGNGGDTADNEREQSGWRR